MALTFGVALVAITLVFLQSFGSLAGSSVEPRWLFMLGGAATLVAVGVGTLAFGIVIAVYGVMTLASTPIHPVELAVELVVIAGAVFLLSRHRRGTPRPGTSQPA